jgi:hypothetical protein
MDCGGKRSTTPLSLTTSGPVSSIYADSSQSGVALRLPPQSKTLTRPPIRQKTPSVLDGAHHLNV